MSPLVTVSTPAMGAVATIVSDAGPVGRKRALRGLVELERWWSRFEPCSEISRLNQADGPVIVSPATAELVQLALSGAAATSGCYDPTIGAHVIAAGYDRSFEQGWGAGHDPSALRSPAAGEVLVDVGSGLVSVPDGLLLDLGGVGKGHAADLMTADLRSAGASVAVVSVGGDVRVSADGGCAVPVDDPLGRAAPARLWIRDSGLAVSGPTRRGGADGRHHLIDPRAGVPADTARVAVVLAGSAGWAEMLATAAAVAPRDEAVAFLEAAGACGWLVELDGEITPVGDAVDRLIDGGWLDAARSVAVAG